MAHVRKQIFDRVETLLTGLGTTGSRIYRSAVHPLTSVTMPGICVYCGPERLKGGTRNATTKEVDIAIDAYVEGDTYDDTFAQIQAEIEAALYGDMDDDGRFFNGLATNLVYAGSDSRYVDTTTVAHGVMEIVYQCEYQTENGDAETAL
ncbi:hypothetical protein OO006_12400 [Prosthecochloris sp. SCSIO W1101]|uniref:hypothetical protein n=1 Tax=Prosthecochloris sp. SCSIO W1101 TaxID=2992242 RepID=UPI00223D8090|nr:hypothetical protein [Prosthecochloris sp. SCSIO W1101]UZJ41131.1 hypothetical protein OO006_12400 [Prosthecochloris sp. SCSIO W1101]